MPARNPLEIYAFFGGDLPRRALARRVNPATAIQGVSGWGPTNLTRCHAELVEARAKSPFDLYESPIRHTGTSRYPGRFCWIPAKSMPE